MTGVVCDSELQADIPVEGGIIRICLGKHDAVQPDSRQHQLDRAAGLVRTHPTFMKIPMRLGPCLCRVCERFNFEQRRVLTTRALRALWQTPSQCRARV